MAAGANRVSRRQLLVGTGGAGLGGLAVGGLGGFFGGRASKSSTSAASTKGAPWVVGAGVPVTGAFSGDGQEMLRGLQLGAAAINAEGGLLGRPVTLSVLDTKEQQSDVMISVTRKFVSQNVAAMVVPFTTYQSVEFPPVAAAGMPMFHINTYQGNLDYVKSKGITNIYEACPSQIWYGPGFVFIVNELLKSGVWKPSSKTISVVTSNDPYSLTIAQAFRNKMEAEGWKTLMFEEFTIPQADWGPVLVNIRKSPPGIVFFSDYTAGDEASFIKQFRQAPTKSLVYQQYAPSVPEYLQLAGSAANGVVWSEMIGLIPDAIGQKFVSAYQSRYHQNPGFGTSPATYDMIRLWAEAAAMAGNPYDFKLVNKILQSMVYRGVCGAYSFVPGILALYPYPERIKDPSIGMPHLTFQIQNGKQVLIYPLPYTAGVFQHPPWL